MNHRPRRGTAVAAAVVVVLLVGALAFLGRGHSKPVAHSHTGATSTVSATTPTTGSDPGRTTSTSPAPTRHGSHDKKHSKQSTTPTTLPTQIVALTSTSASATYPVTSTSYSLTVSASAPCWVLATVAATGSTLWTGTLQAGASQVIEATGTTTVELGAPSATVKVDSVPVVFPEPAHSPFVATFQPTATATATSGGAASTGPTTTSSTSAATSVSPSTTGG
jgi:hypothetical protein